MVEFNENDRADPNILRSTADYYNRRLREHGPSPLGVDWRDTGSQELRFSQLMVLVGDDRDATIGDLGCGYGALAQSLRQRAFNGRYIGVDISTEMITEAQRQCAELDNISLKIGERLPPCDYALASGIYNVKQNASVEDWEVYMRASVAGLAQSAKLGFAFNCLTSYSDPDLMRGDLYYGDPKYWFDHCKREHGRNVALLHDYGLYEWTMLVRK